MEKNKLTPEQITCIKNVLDADYKLREAVSEYKKALKECEYEEIEFEKNMIIKLFSLQFPSVSKNS